MILSRPHEICGRVRHPDSRANRGGCRVVLDGRRHCSAFSKTTHRSSAGKKIRQKIAQNLLRVCFRRIPLGAFFSLDSFDSRAGDGSNASDAVYARIEFQR